MNHLDPRSINLNRYSSDGKVEITRRRNGKMITNTYYPNAHSEHRINAVIQEGNVSVDICGGGTEVVIYFWKQIRLTNYHPPYWLKGWKHGKNGIEWESE